MKLTKIGAKCYLMPMNQHFHILSDNLKDKIFSIVHNNLTKAIW